MAGQFAHNVVERFRKDFANEDYITLKFGDVGNGRVTSDYSHEIFLNLITGSRAHIIDKNKKKILSGCLYNGEYSDGIEEVNFFHPHDWANSVIKNIIKATKEDSYNRIIAPVRSIDFHNRRKPGEISIVYSSPFILGGGYSEESIIALPPFMEVSRKTGQQARFVFNLKHVSEAEERSFI
ncbi:MAG: hypothetical protein JW716_00030 [Candidatus Aenigmarchaeota archaeon]|nr:hypothetical protein [Candidatus Aenigmarchaeota archaeon]